MNNAQTIFDQNSDQKKSLSQEIEKLEKKIKSAKDLPLELQENAKMMIRRVSNLYGSPAYAGEYESASSYFDWIANLPWNVRSEDNLDLDSARQVLDESHYGMEIVKERILEYLAVLSLQNQRWNEAHSSDQSVPIQNNQEEQSEQKLPLQVLGLSEKKTTFKSNVLCLVGLPGIGKTSVAISIAKALNRKFVRIPFGGMASGVLLRGQSRVFPDAEPGIVIKSLRRAGTKNPVILLDEIDRVSGSAKAEINGILLELLDPAQNIEYRDHFIDYPFDLSESMFIATCNNTGGIANAVVNRLEVLQMPAYTDEEKIQIVKNYLLPKEMKNVGLSQKELQVDEDVWPIVIRPLGFEAGVRVLARMVQGICRVVAKRIVLGEGTEFRITPENIKKFLPRS